MRHGLLELEVSLFVFQKSGQHVAFGLLWGFKIPAARAACTLSAIYLVCFQVLAWMVGRLNTLWPPDSVLKKGICGRIFCTIVHELRIPRRIILRTLRRP